MGGQMILPIINPPEFPECQKTCTAFEDDGIGFRDWATGETIGPRCRVTDWYEEIDEDGCVRLYCRRYTWSR